MKHSLNEWIPLKSGFSRVVVFTVFILLIPLISMQFTQEVNWNIADFIVMATLLIGLGSLFVLFARRAPQQQLLLASVFIIVFLYIWAELAVGIFFGVGS